MKILVAAAFVLSATSALAADASGFDSYVEAAAVGPISAHKDVAITRQSSCAIQLKNFFFSEVQQGNFVPHLKITFRSGEDELKRVSVLFDDVIKNIDKDKSLTLRLSNQELTTGVDLSRVTSVKVELRLHRVKDNFADFAEVLRPLLNTVQGAQTTLSIIDNLLAKTQDAAAAPLLFSADFLVAGNVFEYEKLSKNFTDAFLKGNQDYLIGIEALTPIQDSSFKGKVVSLVNAGAKAISGSRVIDPAKAEVKGYATLAFTKYRLSLLPENLETDLREVERGVSQIAFDTNQFNEAARRAENTTAYLESTRAIDARTARTLGEFLSLARVYAAYRANVQTPSWDAQFSDWQVGFKLRAGSLAAQSLGVRNLYSPVGSTQYIAPLYLPYFLSDDLLASFQTWQLLMHRALKSRNSLIAAVGV